MFHHKRPVEATRTGDALVAAFHASDPPLIWHFDLARNHSFSLQLREENRGCWLGLISSEGAFQAIARFASRKDAEEALDVLQKAIARNKVTWFTPIVRMVMAVLAIVLIIVAVYGIVVGWQLFKAWPTSSPSTAQSSSNTQSSVPAAPAKPAMKNGVPEPADQFLQPPP